MTNETNEPENADTAETVEIEVEAPKEAKAPEPPSDFVVDEMRPEEYPPPPPPPTVHELVVAEVEKELADTHARLDKLNDSVELLSEQLFEFALKLKQLRTRGLGRR